MQKTHETRVVIGTSDCDVLGHMNVASYIALCNRNGFAMQTAMGRIPGDEYEGLRLSFAVVREESDFVAEVLSGETLIVQTNIARIGNKSARFRNRILREDGSLVFDSTWDSVCLNLETRRAEIIPDGFRAALEAYLVPDAD